MACRYNVTYYYTMHTDVFYISVNKKLYEKNCIHLASVVGTYMTRAF